MDFGLVWSAYIVLQVLYHYTNKLGVDEVSRNPYNQAIRIVFFSKALAVKKPSHERSFVIFQDAIKFW